MLIYNINSFAFLYLLWLPVAPFTDMSLQYMGLYLFNYPIQV